VTQWLYQIRIKVSKKLSAALRSAVDQAEAKKLHVIAQRHGTRMVCTFDGFSDYCREAELNNTEDYPLYDWTKQTIFNPEKKRRHLKSFAFYKGDDQVYDQLLADALFEDLEPLLGLGWIEGLKKIDSNPKKTLNLPSLTDLPALSPTLKPFSWVLSTHIPK
jgi:hypothetical protein